MTYRISLAFFLLFLTFEQGTTQLYIEKLDEQVNTDEFDELGPVIDINDKTLYFTRVASPDFIKQFSENNKKSDRSLASIFSQITGRKVDNIGTSDFNQDIWIAELDEKGKTTEVIHPEYPVNNAYPNSVCSIFPEENSILVLNQFFDDGTISEGFSKIKKKGPNKFSKPIALEVFEYEDTGTSVNMSMSQDGQHLFISLKRGDSSGKNDLYMSIKIGKNLWSKPQKLNGSINTPYNESSPYISPDKKLLIFASDRPGGMGKHDLYICNRLDYSYKNWSEPQLMEAPINSEFDEYLAYLSNSKKFLYFSSNRDGSSDIFRVDLERPDILPEPLTLNLKIINAETGEVTRGEIQWKAKYDEFFDGFFRTYTGEFEMEIKKNQPYIFQVDKRGFVSESIEINPWELVTNNITQKEIEIYIHPGKKLIEKKEYPFPFGKNRTFTLEDINFEKGTALVKSKSIPSLKEILEVMMEFENLIIQVEGHTDNIGGDTELQQLSLLRAEAIRQYLIENGIQIERLQVKGFGGKKPLNANETESDRETNRRVEIRIIKE